MLACSNCATEIISGASFCHRCGEKTIERQKMCPSCQKSNPVVSVFCHHCGFHFDQKKPKNIEYSPIFPLEFDPETITEQVKAMFFKNLRQRVKDEHDLVQYTHYVERFYDSKFNAIYDVRADQIAEDAMIQWERFGKKAFPNIDNRIETAFEGLFDYFFIHFCQDLNKIKLPQEILKYEHAKPGKTDMSVMINDYLQTKSEPEVFYYDFILMPQDLLANACQSFLTADRSEKLFFICDLSLKGTCKEGFAMTNKGIYWKPQFDKARAVAYSNLDEIKREKDYLTINKYFFTVNPSVNLKVYKLLKKLRAWKETAA
jgi:hypothetical protein